MSFAAPIRIGTRASPLARWQAQWVADQLVERGHAVELVPITTRGDVEQQSPIGDIGTSGVFTKELQRALNDGRIDVAVHSLKDLPTDDVAGLALAAVPPRESPRDALICREGKPLDALLAGARIGTGSLRRQAQLRYLRSDLQMDPIRGNVETRLRKLAAGECDAIVLAEAGLKRLGFDSRITQFLEPPLFLPAVGQGALGLEVRVDSRRRPAVAVLDDPLSRAAVVAERAFLAELDGGCLAPIGAWGRIDLGGRLKLDGVVLSPDGSVRLIGSVSGSTDQAALLGVRLAGELLVQGASNLVNQARGTP
ncbi:MAG TPA: hydroxymethylbilane synthase [Pirellulales bacterium]|jgi:hydroxymethylbilane synthase|nr:hydroxymethylbilane synthase [Pirellulales bacterium]